MRQHAGRLDDGRSFALGLPSSEPAVFVAGPDGPRALALLSPQDAVLDALPWADLAFEPFARLELRKGSPDESIANGAGMSADGWLGEENQRDLFGP